MAHNFKISVLRDLGVNETDIPRMLTYIELLWRSNEDLNLFSRKMTFDELIDNHLIDCLLPFKQFPTDIKDVADFGSGGGLPGVLYAICFPEITFHLYEKSPKKQEFLNRCRELAPNMVIHGEIPVHLKKIDLVMSRAFKPLDVLLEISREYYLNGGRYFLLKGRREKIDEEIQLALKKFKELKVNVLPLQSPVLDVERHLVQI